MPSTLPGHPVPCTRASSVPPPSLRSLRTLTSITACINNQTHTRPCVVDSRLDSSNTMSTSRLRSGHPARRMPHCPYGTHGSGKTSEHIHYIPARTLQFPQKSSSTPKCFRPSRTPPVRVRTTQDVFPTAKFQNLSHPTRVLVHGSESSIIE